MAKPGSSASTSSSRWYYRVDRVNHRRCWFLSTRDLSAHSRMRRASSLRRRHLISRSTGETDVAQQSELDEQTVARPTPRQGPMLPDEQTLRELAAPQFDVLTSQGLVPHKVTTISYARPHSGAPTARGRLVDAMGAGEQSVARRVNVDLVFLGGALATALLVAGGAFQVIGRIQRTGGRVSTTRLRVSRTQAPSGKKSLYERLNIARSLPAARGGRVRGTLRCEGPSD